MLSDSTGELNSRVIGVPAISTKYAVQEFQQWDFLFAVALPWDGVKSREEFPKRDDKIEANGRVAGYLPGSLVQILAATPCVSAEFIK